LTDAQSPQICLSTVRSAAAGWACFLLDYREQAIRRISRYWHNQRGVIPGNWQPQGDSVMTPRKKFRVFGKNQISQANTAPLEPVVEETKGPRQVIEQAARDVSRGLRDTDLHGTPSNVPGPGPAPENSPGAEVPPEGVDANK
jgi:hypothetical protein